MATYTNLTDWTDLQVGDVVNYSTSGLTINAKGFKFGCRLKGSSRTSGSISMGANCYAEIDLKSISDGNITLGSNYGSYIAYTNGSGTDVRYNRFIVAGDCGYASWTNGRDYYYHNGVNGGLFGGSGSTGAFGSYTAYGGTQTSGGTASSPSGSKFHAYTGVFGGDSFGRGWYSGGAAYRDWEKGYEYGDVAGAGSSYLLTNDSYKPDGYMSEWSSIVNLISNPESSVLTSERDYYCTITIIESGTASTTRTVTYYTGSEFKECNVKYFDGTEFVSTNISIYNGSTWV